MPDLQDTHGKKELYTCFVLFSNFFYFVAIIRGDDIIDLSQRVSRAVVHEQLQPVWLSV